MDINLLSSIQEMIIYKTLQNMDISDKDKKYLESAINMVLEIEKIKHGKTDKTANQ